MNGDAVRSVLAQYDLGKTVTDLSGHRGGFSGALILRCKTSAGDLCLRAWPTHTSDAHLVRVHRLMRTAHDLPLPFVPRVQVSRSGTSFIAAHGRLWDLTTWMPGRADFREAPSPRRLAEACAALAQVHRAWEGFAHGAGPCPAIRRRLERQAAWQGLRSSGWVPDFEAAALEIASLARRAWPLIEREMPRIHALLEPLAARAVLLQPCLCDVWHDHLLFEGERLTGLIDYGEVKTDHVAVDLARMLGSLVEDDEQGWAAGIAAYRGVRSLSDEETELARVLDRTGSVLAVANWLRWLYHDGRRFDDGEAVRRRLALLVERLDRREHEPPRLRLLG